MTSEASSLPVSEAIAAMERTRAELRSVVGGGHISNSRFPPPPFPRSVFFRKLRSRTDAQWMATIATAAVLLKGPAGWLFSRLRS